MDTSDLRCLKCHEHQECQQVCPKSHEFECRRDGYCKCISGTPIDECRIKSDCDGKCKVGLLRKISDCKGGRCKCNKCHIHSDCREVCSKSLEYGCHRDGYCKCINSSSRITECKRDSQCKNRCKGSSSVRCVARYGKCKCLRKLKSGCSKDEDCDDGEVCLGRRRHKAGGGVCQVKFKCQSNRDCHRLGIKHISQLTCVLRPYHSKPKGPLISRMQLHFPLRFTNPNSNLATTFPIFIQRDLQVALGIHS